MLDSIWECLLDRKVVRVAEAKTPRAKGMAYIAHFLQILPNHKKKLINLLWKGKVTMQYSALSKSTFGNNLKSVGSPIGSRMAGDTRGRPVLCKIEKKCIMTRRRMT